MFGLTSDDIVVQLRNETPDVNNVHVSQFQMVKICCILKA